MEKRSPFALLLKQHVDKDGRHARQLAKATVTLFGVEHRVANTTISRWLRGSITKPRNRSDIVKLCAVLRLSWDELLQLLQAAGHDLPDVLETSPSLPGLFDHWQGPISEELPPFQVPKPLTTFIGRTEALRSVGRYFGSQQQNRVCCLLGMAGLGKTSLAAQLANQLRDQFTDGILWIGLDQTDPMSAMLGIAEAYGIDLSAYPDLGTRSSKYRELLANKNALLILDQAEDDEQLRPLLPPSGPCSVLITSRRRDLALADTTYCVVIPLFNREQEESLSLFRTVLGKKIVQEQVACYKQLANFLGHLPLAIEIVAQRLKHEPGWTAVQMLERLHQSSQPLSLLIRGDLQIRNCLAISYKALAESDQQIFALLGMFPNSFTAGSVAAIAEQSLWEVEDSLRRIYANSLLFIKDNRYKLHPLVRAFSQEKPQSDQWANRFVTYFASQVTQAGTAVAEQHNIIAAINMAASLQLEAVVVTAVIQFYPHLQRTGQFEQAKSLLSLAEEKARRSDNEKGVIRILQQSGFTAMKRGLPNEADGYYQEALALALKINDVGQTAEILHKLSALAYRRGRLEEAQQFCQEALVLAHQVENWLLVANLLTNLGLAEAASGRFSEAIAHYQEALTIARQIDDAGLIINVLQNLGHVHEQRGNYAQAKTYYEDGLVMAETQKDPELRSRMLGNLGAVACHLGNYAEASAHFRAGLALADANELTIQQYRQQANLGQVAVLRGQFRQANTHFREALALVRQLDFAEDLGIVLNQAGECYLKQDMHRDAADYFNEALQIAEAMQFQQVGSLSLFGLARVAAARGNIGEARQLGERSRQQLVAVGHRKANEVWWWLQELPRSTAPD